MQYTEPLPRDQQYFADATMGGYSLAPHPAGRPPHVPLFPGAVRTNIASGHGTAVSSSWVLLGCSSDLSLSLVLHRLSPCRSHRAQPMPSHLCRYTHAALGGCSVRVSCVRSRDHTTTGERGLCGAACTLTEPPRPGSGRPRCCVTLHAALSPAARCLINA